LSAKYTTSLQLASDEYVIYNCLRRYIRRAAYTCVRLPSFRPVTCNLSIYFSDFQLSQFSTTAGYRRIDGSAIRRPPLLPRKRIEVFTSADQPTHVVFIPLASPVTPVAPPYLTQQAAQPAERLQEINFCCSVTGRKPLSGRCCSSVRIQKLYKKLSYR